MKRHPEYIELSFSPDGRAPRRTAAHGLETRATLVVQGTTHPAHHALVAASLGTMGRAMGFSAGQHATILGLARAFVREALERRPLSAQFEINAELHQPAGCFVSLHVRDDHRLRGCVGRVDSSQPFIEALRAASAHVLADPRFTQCPVCLEELSRLTIEVSVILPPRAAAHAMDFDLLNDGIYLSFGSRSGCFLPQVARETGWTREQLLDRLCIEKLGLPAPTWRHPQARLHAFSVQVIGPEPFEGG